MMLDRNARDRVAQEGPLAVEVLAQLSEAWMHALESRVRHGERNPTAPTLAAAVAETLCALIPK
jgi:hypothetical protein